MKAYSNADLLGRESQLSETKSSIIFYIESWLERQTKTVELQVTIPHPIYLRTRLICDYIQSVYEIDMNTTDFINTLFVDFIHRNMKKHNPRKMYEELKKSFPDSDTLQINDHLSNKVYNIRKKYNSDIVLGYSLSKKEVKRAELILAELDETIGEYMKVEHLIASLWINFIQSFSDGNNEKAIDKIIKMLSKNF